MRRLLQTCKLHDSGISLLVTVLLFLPAGHALGSPPTPTESDQTKSLDTQKPAPLQRNFSMKTLGGRQFWGDLHFFRGWRIQQHCVSGHCRLLDPEDYRHASGDFDECHKKLEEVRKAQSLKPMSGKAVILIHGIIRSSKSFSRLSESLEKDGYTVVGFDYPSTRVTIPTAADYLRRTIESLQGIEEINFVVHSMGGLVVRCMLTNQQDERFHRMVMLGVPNHGALMADKLKNNVVFKAVMGPAGQQLVSQNDGLIPNLPVPSFEFAVIAGGRHNGKGFNPLLDGDDDGTVSVISTRLQGAADFAVVNCLHSFLMFNDDVDRMTRYFLLHGRLRKEGAPRPIPAIRIGSSDAGS